MRTKVTASYVVRGVDSNDEPWMTRQLIWPSCDSEQHRRYVRLQCQAMATRMNKAGAEVSVVYQELDDDGFWKDAEDKVEQ